MSHNTIRSFTLASLVAAASLAAGIDAARAAVVTPLNLQKPPLFLNAAVDPNIAVTFDDSGSMTSAFMPDNVDDNCNYRHPKFYSNVFNRIYYNPNSIYIPPLKLDGTSFPQASFTGAWEDGYEGNGTIVTGAVGSPTVNLGTKYFPTRTKNSRANDNGTRITNRTETVTTPAPTHLRGGPAYTGTGTLLGCDATYTDNNTAWLPFAANTGTGSTATSKAFYYRFTGTPAEINDATKYVAVDVSAGTAAEKQNFANWYSYYRTRTLMGRTAMSRVFGVQGNNLRVAFQNLNTTAYRFNNGTTKWDKFVDVSATVKPRTDFFQWLYREDASGGTPLRASAIRAGEAFKYGSSTITNSTNPYYEPAPVGRELTCRQNFHITLTDGFWNESAPGGYTGINDQTNRTLPTIPGPPAVTLNYTRQRPYGNEPATADNPTLADITFNYWATDLRTDLANVVPPYYTDRTLGDWDPANDPATWQHVVQYIVGLGVAGTLNFPGDYAALKNPAATTPNWPAPVNNSPPAVDDAWHAALNSRGEYFSAADPDELVDSLSAVLQSVLIRQGRGSAATVTSGIIQASTLAFRTAYDSSDWSGQVVGYKVDQRGFRIEPPIWDAGAVLTARTAERNIITSSGPSGGGIPFRWGSLPTGYQTKLQDNPATVAVDNDGLGQDRLDWLRGSHARELPAGPLRVRPRVLGAIVNSSAVVVAGPSQGYTDDNFPVGSPERATSAVKYSEFRNTNRNRRRVVYVGANDGMLHSFDAGSGATGFDSSGNPIVDAGSGEELWAYVPFEVAGSLSQLTNPAYSFTPYVDNTPTVRDVFIGGRWRTVLIGALRRGGQGIYALDVTNPAITEADAASVVMWEFSDDSTVGTGFDSKQLGYTYGKPNISRLANGKWVVVVPASYNSDETSDTRVGTGNSTLFVLDIADGSVLKQFDLTGSKGLTSPTMGDYNDDFIDEFAVAGDLNGNMWRFDLSDPLPANWAVRKLFAPAVDGDQPITSAPRIFPDPATAGLIVVFGTGKYLEPVDRGNAIPQQRFYGVREQGPTTTTATIADLVPRTLTRNATTGYVQFSGTIAPIGTSQRGWYINMLEAGERDVTPAGALFSLGVAIFSTVIPNGNDPCAPSLRGNIYLFDAATGSAPAIGAIIDTNGDGRVNASDDATVIGVGVSEAAAEGSPAVLVGAGGGAGNLVDYPDIQVPQTVWRRRSWRELPNQ